jgi:hypothetical protein
MRNLTAKQLLLFLSLTVLILAALSSASGLFDSEPEPEPQPNFSAEKIKAMESGQITCLPQNPPSEQLWRCEDAYGNPYENLTIKQNYNI